MFHSNRETYTLVGEQIYKSPQKNTPAESLRHHFRPHLKPPSVEKEQDYDWSECLQGLASLTLFFCVLNPFHWLSECQACGRLIEDALTSPRLQGKIFLSVTSVQKKKKETHIYATLKVATGRW